MIENSRSGFARRALLGAAALPLFAIGRPAGAAEFEFRFATGQSATNPINTRLQQGIDRIAKATDGRVQMKLFPNNQLGSDTDQIQQLRSGGIEFLNVSNSVLSTLVPAAALVNVGFAFTSYDQVWRGLDGELGSYMALQIERAGIAVVGPFADNGFRHITSSEAPIRTPANLRGFHIRVPVSPIFTSLFQALGASPTSINFNEVYTALQTKLVGGQENGYVVIETAKLYEVQKYLAMTSHIYDCFAVMANRRAFGRLPDDVQTVVRRELKAAVFDQRADSVKLDRSLKETLQKDGMEIVEVDRGAFRAALQKSTFYADWRGKFGDAAWAALQSVSGPLG